MYQSGPPLHLPLAVERTNKKTRTSRADRALEIGKPDGLGGLLEESEHDSHVVLNLYRLFQRLEAYDERTNAAA